MKPNNPIIGNTFPINEMKPINVTNISDDSHCNNNDEVTSAKWNAET